MRFVLGLSAVAATALILAGCAEEQHQDLKQWMTAASKDLQGRVQPVPEIKAFPIVSYDAGDLLDPFSPAKVIPEKRQSAAGPDFDRPREPLEAYPLESLKMVGIVKQKSVLHALIQAGNMVHQVKVGNHLGQDFGVITGITEAEVRIKELVQDPSGQTADWLERTATLQLIEQAPMKEAKK